MNIKCSQIFISLFYFPVISLKICQVPRQMTHLFNLLTKGPEVKFRLDLALGCSIS